MKTIVKIRKSLLLMAVFTVFLTAFMSCSEEKKEGGYYSCPMHPEIKEAKMGECPECGMDLEHVESAEHMKKHEENSHEKTSEKK